MKPETLVVPSDLNEISTILNFIEETLKAKKVKRSSISEAMLLTEESLVRLIETGKKDSDVYVKIFKRLGNYYVKLSIKGDELKSFTEDAFYAIADDEETAIRDLLLKAFGEKIRYHHKGKFNLVDIMVGSQEYVFSILAIQAIILALGIGLFVEYLTPTTFSRTLDVTVLQPIQDIYINILMVVVGPALLFSIIASVAECSSFFDTGKITIKTFTCFFLTSIIAIFISCLLFCKFSPEYQVIISSAQENSVTGWQAGVYQIIEMFKTDSTLQILVVAIAAGLAVGRIGEYSAMVKNIVMAIKELFIQVFAILMLFVPVVTFTSTMSMLINVDDHHLASLGYLFLLLLLGVIIMIVIYSLIIMIGGRQNPIKVLIKFINTMKTSFLWDSSYTVMNKTMRYCKNRLGISPKVYKFSIPFGFSFNMDGSCIYLTIAGLFIMGLCGIEPTVPGMIVLGLSVFFLSIASPITPGSEFICLVALIKQFGLSVSSIGIVLGVTTIIGMVIRLFNTYGDVAVTLAIAKSEGLIDESKIK